MNKLQYRYEEITQNVEQRNKEKKNTKMKIKNSVYRTRRSNIHLTGGSEGQNETRHLDIS